jgi:DNA-binding CsgD family transcriptional regulator
MNVPDLPRQQRDSIDSTAARRLGDVVATGRNLQAAIHRATETAVLRMRIENNSWLDVAKVLGVSKQTAWAKWRHVDKMWPAGIEVRVLGGRAFFWSPDLEERVYGGEVGRLDAAEILRAVMSSEEQLRELQAAGVVVDQADQP